MLHSIFFVSSVQYNMKGVIIVLVFIFVKTEASVGGHDLFTSLAQLEVLWQNEMEVVKTMEAAISKLDSATQALKEYVASHKQLTLDKGPNYDFLGHPINAYHFIRHVASGWDKIQRHVIGNETIIDDLNLLRAREEEKLPDEYDVQGGAFGLVRLKSLYNFKMKKFVQDGIIDAKLDNGQAVLSKPSVLKLNSYDLYQMAAQGCESQLYDACTDFYQASLDVGQNETDHNGYFSFRFENEQAENALKLAKQMHDHTLVRAGQRTHMHRCHKKPFDEKLKKKKAFKKAPPLPKIIGRAVHFEFESNAIHDSALSKVVTNAVETQKDELCRGKELRPLSEVGRFKCFYGHGGSTWLRIGPFKIEENSLDPYHVTIHELLYEHECNNITQFLGPMLNFPPGRMRTRSAQNDWTMKNCWPNEGQNDYLQKLNRRIEHISGLRASSFENFSEPYMCGNYGIGGHYWIHPDFHHANPSFYKPGNTGNRVATILTVLEHPEAGGATVWPYAGISVFGRKGSGLFWHNLYASDMTDAFTKHAACPVLLGQKWIGNKWVGYNGQWNRRHCLLEPHDPFRPIRSFQDLSFLAE